MSSHKGLNVVVLIACLLSIRSAGEASLTEAQKAGVSLFCRLSCVDLPHIEIAEQICSKDGESVLRLSLGDGGDATVHKSSGTVYSYIAPSFHAPEELPENEMVSDGGAFVAILPILEYYGLSSNISDYAISYIDTVGCTWNIESRFLTDGAIKPPSLYVVLAADTAKLLMVMYLPPLPLPNASTNISEKEAAEIAQGWLMADESPVHKWKPQVEATRKTLIDSVRGNRATLDNWPWEQRALTRELHICWGVPFTTTEHSTTFGFYLWIDVETGEIIDISEKNQRNR